MRIVVLINPKVPCEHGFKGNDYAEASFGMDSPATDATDSGEIAKTLRMMADLLETPAVAVDPSEVEG